MPCLNSFSLILVSVVNSGPHFTCFLHVREEKDEKNSASPVMSCESRAKWALTIEIRGKCGREWLTFRSFVENMINLCSPEGINSSYIISLYFTVYGPCLMWNSHLSFGESSDTFSPLISSLRLCFRLTSCGSSRNETRLCRHGSKNCTFSFPRKWLKATSSSPWGAVTILAMLQSCSIVFGIT